VSTEPVSSAREDRGWLRENRLRVAAVVGAVETIAIALTEATWRYALVAGAIAFALYIVAVRRDWKGTQRDLAWTAAASQVLPVLVPVIIYAVGLAIIVAVVALAVVIALMLYFDRR
jgi:hypothetical protein